MRADRGSPVKKLVVVRSAIHKGKTGEIAVKMIRNNSYSLDIVRVLRLPPARFPATMARMIATCALKLRCR